MIIGGLKLTVRRTPFFLNFSPFLLNARQNPLITTGMTIGLFCLMIRAVPFLPGAKGLVVSWGKVITQLSASARVIFRVSLGSNPLLTSLPPWFQVLFTVRAPARAKRRLTQLPFIVSSA